MLLNLIQANSSDESRLAVMTIKLSCNKEMFIANYSFTLRFPTASFSV